MSPHSVPAVLALVLITCAAPASSGEDPTDAPAWVSASGGPLLDSQAAFDVQHYDLALIIDPDHRQIAGTLTMTANVIADTDTIALHLDDRLFVERVHVGEVLVEHVHADGLITIPLPPRAGSYGHGPDDGDGPARAAVAGDTLVVSVAYRGSPREAPRPPWDGGFTWSETPSGEPWIATTCQGEGADLWWPCKDHPSDKPETMDLRITVPDDLVVASNGTLVSDARRGAALRTFHWHVANPISNYNVALNIAPYDEITTIHTSVTGERFPVVFYVLPEDRARGQEIFPQFLDHLTWFEETIGPYPFRNEKYGIVQTPHLGMEHQTIIAYGNDFKGLSDGYDWLHHHELSHEWWGNLVTNADWKDMWIHEGIGTYMQALYLEDLRGAEGYRAEMAANHRFANKKPVAPREIRDSKQIYFAPDGGYDNDIYNKGSWVVHTLRWLIGKDAVMTTLQRMAYPEPAVEGVPPGGHPRFVDTDDFVTVAEEACDCDLDWFAEVYLRQPELPALIVEEHGGVLQLRWDVPGGLDFPMPVPVRVDGEDRRVPMPDGAGALLLAADSTVEIDPDGWLLRAPDSEPAGVSTTLGGEDE